MWLVSISRSQELSRSRSLSLSLHKYTLAPMQNDEQINDIIWKTCELISNQKDIFHSIADGFCSVWRSFGSHSFPLPVNVTTSASAADVVAVAHWCYSIDLFSSPTIHSPKQFCLMENVFMALFLYFSLALIRINHTESMGRPIEFINDN